MPAGFDFCEYFGPGYEGCEGMEDCGQAQNFIFELERMLNFRKRSGYRIGKSPAGAGIKRIVLCGKTGRRPPVFRRPYTVAKMMEEP